MNAEIEKTSIIHAPGNPVGYCALTGDIIMLDDKAWLVRSTFPKMVDIDNGIDTQTISYLDLEKSGATFLYEKPTKPLETCLSSLNLNYWGNNNK